MFGRSFLSSDPSWLTYLGLSVAIGVGVKGLTQLVLCALAVYATLKALGGDGSAADTLEVQKHRLEVQKHRLAVLRAVFAMLHRTDGSLSRLSGTVLAKLRREGKG
jgi:hypothetical protein